MSLRPKLLAEFDKSMIKAGFTDRSKAIQTALHSFVDEHNWKDDLPKSGDADADVNPLSARLRNFKRRILMQMRPCHPDRSYMDRL
jgi:hypothetical protein